MKSWNCSIGYYTHHHSFSRHTFYPRLVYLQQNKKGWRPRVKKVCLLWNDKEKAKNKTFFWMSRWGKTKNWSFKNVVYYETIKREVKIKPISECRYDGRLKTKVEESKRLSDTGLFGELEHLKTETRLIDEKFAIVMGECVIWFVMNQENER
jgi:hypothetical protein